MLGLEAALPQAFWASYVLLWLLLIVMSVLVFLLYRQYGLMLMNSRAGVERDGPALGSMAPRLSVLGDDRSSVDGQIASGAPTLVLFAAPECQPCHEIVPHIDDLPTRLPRQLDVVTVMAAGAGQSIEFRTPKVGHVLLDHDRETFTEWEVNVTPFAVVIDSDGKVLSKGLCNGPAELDALVGRAGLLGVGAADDLAIGA
jgi:methylamine dehydrogenase accessory protein MauD